MNIYCFTGITISCTLYICRLSRPVLCDARRLTPTVWNYQYCQKYI